MKPELSGYYELTSTDTTLTRVRTEIGNQNSRTFPGLFKDYLHFPGVIFHGQ